MFVVQLQFQDQLGMLLQFQDQRGMLLQFQDQVGILATETKASVTASLSKEGKNCSVITCCKSKKVSAQSGPSH